MPSQNLEPLLEPYDPKILCLLGDVALSGFTQALTVKSLLAPTDVSALKVVSILVVLLDIKSKAVV